MLKIVLPFTLFLVCNLLKAQVISTDELPVSIKTFDIAKNANKIQLSWKVACFIDQANFEVQRSGDGVQYVTINSFSADKLRCSQPFYYDDMNVAGKVYYRLKVGNKDGQFFSSKVVSVNGKANGFNVNSLQPTIVRNNALLSISSSENSLASIRIVNMGSGQIESIKTLNLFTGRNDITLNLSNLPKGSFAVYVENAGGDKKIIKFLKQ